MGLQSCNPLPPEIFPVLTPLLYMEGPAEQFVTQQFGKIEFDPAQVIEFPEGLPAFEQERRFVSIERPATAPFIFLQSLSSAELVFITLPIHLVDPSYELNVCAEDLQALALPDDRQPKLGADVIALVVITVAEDSAPTANLMAPILINVRTQRALQAIQTVATNSHVHPLPVPDGPTPAAEGKC